MMIFLFINWNFNPRSHEGSDFSPFKINNKFDVHFNPRSHEGSDSQSNISNSVSCIISIHAPTKGATLMPKKSIDTLAKISIHAPTKGATTSIAASNCELMIISIHAPTKGATICSIPYSLFLRISIHAPTKGATCPYLQMCTHLFHFNPRSHEGSDLISSSLSVLIKVFQSTLPRRERLNGINATQSELISIHAPTKGATTS